jgi:UDP-glucose 4-epimerase
MTSIVTGGAGFIGSHLVDELLKKGEQVVSIDNYSRGSQDNLKVAMCSKNLVTVEGDLVSENFANEHIKNAEIVFHLAAINGTKHFYERPRSVIETNLRSTQNVLSASVRNGIKKIIFSSSSEVYGYPRVFPTSEDSPPTFDSPSVPRWSYGVSKFCDEHLCYAYAREFGIPIIIVRLFNTYGPRLLGTPEGQVVSIFIKSALEGRKLQIFGKGEQTRSFCYVSDTVDGIIRGANYPAESAEIFNIGNETEITINELARKVLEACGSRSSQIEHLPQMIGDSPRRVPSLEKARKLLGYSPKVDLQTGLEQTIEWFRNGRS